ncbi:hypothetical protein HYQ19_gp101 [Arthrobacter phage DrYang]|uniref:Uncharacterized protein n=1 Tax=Arthrobacter phage DrYang TaxID=2686080 RepID=A0A6B9J7E4_9CAUD|nr:hypothetical protein HYQ19_gp101 [Arthrobacter phage DrYang]QGZ17200.1 hypothetical protein SEA_DRYANG_101 [Arthrobacter phage DrYang]
MDLLNIWFHVFPWLTVIACVNLSLIVVWMWFPRPHAITKAYREGLAAGYADGVEHGRNAGYRDGHKQGVEDNHLEEAHFIKCPECDHAIHVPTIMRVEGEPGSETVICEPDTTELWVHMNGHKAGTVDLA